MRRTVATFSNDPDKQGVHGSHVFSLSDADLSHGQTWHGMLADDGLHLRIFKNTVADHMAGASGKHFLTRLKKKLHCARKRICQRPQDFRRAKQRRGVKIMATGVHHVCMLRGIRYIVHFLNGQSIHIGAKGQNGG